MPFTHVSEPQSSGSDDDVLIGMGAGLATAALLWTAARARRRFGAWDIGVHAVLVTVQVIYFLLIPLDEGSIPLTIVHDRNWVLVAWIATLGALVSFVAVAALGGTAENERVVNPLT